MIVDIEWLRLSILKKQILDPYSYEIGGTINDLYLKGPTRARINVINRLNGRNNLLKNYTFTIIDRKLVDDSYSKLNLKHYVEFLG